eukprot:14293089-Alexandrium_andersonii.AAC.1
MSVSVWLSVLCPRMCKQCVVKEVQHSMDAWLQTLCPHMYRCVYVCLQVSASACVRVQGAETDDKRRKRVAP